MTANSSIEGMGLGWFELRYLRDKLERELDFLVVRDRNPWFLVEVKTRDTALSDSLRHFQAATRAPHAFQAVMELPYGDIEAHYTDESTSGVAAVARETIEEIRKS